MGQASCALECCAPEGPGQDERLHRRASLQGNQATGYTTSVFLTSQGDGDDFEKNYDVCEVLGEGGSAVVKKCRRMFFGADGSELKTGELGEMWRAVKLIPKKGKVKGVTKKMDRIAEEIAIMKVVEHPNITKLIETFESDQHLYVVLELCSGGDLFAVLERGGAFDEQVACLVAGQMFRAVNYLHINGVVHRDIKPENFLLASKGGVIMSALKLADFGLARWAKLGQQLRSKVGTPYYTAPEVLMERYTEKADVWSCGVLLFLLLVGSLPFGNPDMTTDNVFKAVEKASADFTDETWGNISQPAKSFVKRLLNKDSHIRPSAADCLRDEWLSTLRQDAPSQTIIANTLRALRDFAELSALQRCAYHILALQLDEKATKGTRNLFLALDDNNDGTVSLAELKAAVKKATGKLPPDLQDLMQTVDSDGSGVLDYTEFIAATMDKKKYTHQTMCFRVFAQLDRDSSGKISLEEVMRIFKGEKEKAEVQQALRETDKNHDGELDFKEFCNMMAYKPRRSKNKAEAKGWLQRLTLSG